MDLKVTILWIILYCDIVCLSAKTSLTYNYFSVITDQRRIDGKAHAYIKWQKSAIGRALLRLPLTVFHHICSANWIVQSRICRQTLQFEENGFMIGSTTLLSTGCATALYSVRFSTLAKAETVSLSMVTCPMVLYLDLETDIYEELPYVFKISHARKFNSAVMYVQTDPQSNEIHPFRFIKNIAFRKMKSDMLLKRASSLDALVETEISNTADIRPYLTARQADSPYVKFEQLFASMNVCGRPRPHKIYLCKRCLKQHFPGMVGMEFDLAGYDVIRCKRHRISLENEQLENEQLENEQLEHEQLENEQLENEQTEHLQSQLSIFRCPPMRTEYRSTRNFFHIYYVSSNTRHHSLTLFGRENQKGTLPKPEANIDELQMEPIFQDVKRLRFLPVLPKTAAERTPASESYRQIEAEINSLDGPIASPSTLVKFDLPLSYLKAQIDEKVLQRIYTKKWLPDRVTIAFSKIINTQLIYHRFMRTFTSIDICSLSIAQRTLLCNEAFKKEKPANEVEQKYRIDEKDKKEPELPFNEDSPSTYCTKNHVKISTVDADELEMNRFSMWECNGNIESTQNIYFLGKNHLKNAATIYVRLQIRAENYFYPRVLIAGINKYGLVKNEIENKIKEKTENEIISEIDFT